MATHGSRTAGTGKVAVAGPLKPRDRLTASRPELLVGGSDTQLRGLVYGILGMTTRFDRLRERIGQLIGLSGLQYHIVMALADMEPGYEATVGEVARALHVTGAYITTETAKLVRAGLVAKRPNPDDRREVRLALTPKARRAIGDLTPALREINDELFGFLTRERFDAFAEIMAEMVDSTERAVRVAERLRDQRTSGAGRTTRTTGKR
jgi:DNA-binding MarR family transcriptional regulator